MNNQRKYKLKGKNGYFARFKWIHNGRVLTYGPRYENYSYGKPTILWNQDGALINISQLNGIINTGLVHKLTDLENVTLESYDYKKVINNMKLDTLRDKLSQKMTVQKLKGFI